MPCPFCDILQNNTERIVKKNSHSFVILSNPRLMPGHLLVIPNRHVEKMSDLNAHEKHDLLETVIDFQEKILKKLSNGCDISQHYRPFIQQGKLKINHLHVHLRPRELEDALYERAQKFERDVFQDLDDEELKRFISLFKED